MFKEFERLDGKNPENGLGLGLAIVEQACKALNHPLNLWSELGQGSCFSFVVPMDGKLSQTNIPNTTWHQMQIKKPHFEDLIVMLIENDPQFATAVTMMIEACGADVIHAENSEEAEQLLRDIQLIPDAMLIDFQLGAGLSGTELYQLILDEYGPVPAAIISADRSRVLRNECRNLGLPLISKPVKKQRLWNFLSEAAQNIVQQN